MELPKQIRLNKYLASSGICSRRSADELIKSGKVFLNGKKAVLGDTFLPGDVVKVNSKVVKQKEKKVYLAYNKPKGVICTADKESKNNIVAAVNYPTRIFPVGRLDVASTGLIFLTNDGDWANRLMHPKYVHEKEYRVTVDKTVDRQFLNNLTHGVKLGNVKAKADDAVKTGDREMLLTLHQGLNRQIRRMCEKLGYQVLELKRIRIGNFLLDNLPVGQSKKLTALEAEKI